jgi:hypothetical protein
MNCPVCDRELVPGNSVNKHHLIPKLKGGKEAFSIHKICHSKIHSLWSENELRDVYNNWESIKADEQMKKFIKFVSKKEPEFIDSNKLSNNHKKRRRK